jgi:cell division protein FtsW
MMKEDTYSQTLGIIFVSCVIILIGIGLGFLYSINKSLMFTQAVYLIVGLFAFFAGFFINPDFYKKNIKIIVILTFIMLILTLIPFIGKEVGGGRRWIALKIPGIKFQPQFQPSELAKLTVVFYLSFVLANKQDFIKDFYKGILPPLVLVVFISFLVFAENDFSTTFVILFVSMIIFFLAGIRLATFIMLGMVGVLSGSIMLFFAQYRITRLFAFLNPWEDPRGSGWHYIQSMKSFALGGFFGIGIGESVQKNFSLPESHNDYIFAVIGEEGGAFFSLIIILLFFAVILIGFNIAKRSEDKNLFLLSSGLSSLIFIQAIINIGVTLGVLPSTGLTLPFISAGGTSLVVFMFTTGVIMNIAFANNRRRRLL